MFNLWINVPGEKLKKIAKIVGNLHNASLMCEGAVFFNTISSALMIFFTAL
jgi:hypothetical protein